MSDRRVTRKEEGSLRRGGCEGRVKVKVAAGVARVR